nr:hypothetical protein [Anaerolineae bacterium]
MAQPLDQNYDYLDIQTLTNLLSNPEKGADIHAAAFKAMCKLGPDGRRAGIVSVMRSIIKRPEKYETDLMMGVVEILATDPDPDATVAMLELLPEVLDSAMKYRDRLSPEFREYFYEALVTRSRDGDLDIWAEWLPKMTGKILVAALLDPVGKALEAIEPLVLLDRLAEPERTSAYMGLIAMKAATAQREELMEIAANLQESNNPEQLEKGLDSWAKRYDKAKEQGSKRYAANMQAMLALLDSRPRTAIEKLTGKRPWAS